MGAQDVRLVRRFTLTWLNRKLRRKLEALRVVQPRLNRDQLPTAGLEVEVNLVTDTGYPAHGLAAVVLEELQRHGENRVTTELGDWQLEINLTPRSIIGQPFTTLFDEARTLLERINEIASHYGAQAVLIGTLPTLTIDDIAERYLSPVDRYPHLDHGLWHGRAPETLTLHLPSGETREVVVDTVRWEMVCTSVQPHFYFPGHNSVVIGHNVAVATAGPIIALAGNAPYAYGAAPVNDARSTIFGAATAQRCWVNGYINDPLDPIKKALEFPPILTKTDHECSLWRARRGGLPNLVALNVQNGTVWPMLVREVVDLLSLHQRHEIRYQSAGPTLEDVFAFLVLTGGIMSNPRSGEIVLRLEEQDALNNFEAGCQDGPAAALHWTSQTTSTPHAIVRELRRLAQEGWERWGIGTAEIERFLAPIDALVDGQPSGATWQRGRVQHYVNQGHSHSEALRLMLLDYMSHAAGGLGQSVIHWPAPANEPALAGCRTA